MVRGRTSSKGFTIVELLIVVVVIAILAAITIVSYTGITGRAYTASVQTEFRNAMQSIEKYKVENGMYPSTGTNTELAAANIRINTKNYDETGSNFLYCVNNTTSRAALTALGTNGVLYAQSTDRAFGPYTTYTISSYANICSDLVGSSSARYGRSASETPNWRVWVNP